jgi:hypothetical protein
MTNLELALTQARNGYPVFPCQQDKRPKAKLMDWEQAATTDEDQIREWWAEDQSFLVAVPPGRVGKAVIDVDRHVGKEDGFKSLEEERVELPSTFHRPSISGNGEHFWYDGEIGSVNGVFPGVDRKARGGYIVTAYILPPPDQITTPIPLSLSGSSKSSDVARRYLSNAQLNSWLREVGYGEPDDEMWEAVERFLPRGHQQMVSSVASVASLAAQGHPGASVALERMQEKWLEGDHNSGDPEVDFLAAVQSAIEKFGEPVPETTFEDTMNELLNPPPPPPDIESLRLSLLTFCRRVRVDFDQLLQSEESVRNAFLQCDHVVKTSVHTSEEAQKWIIGAQAAMTRVLERFAQRENL